MQNGKSVAEQDQWNLQYINDMRWTTAGRYSDNDRPAGEDSPRGREDWERLVTDISQNKIDILVVWEPSRATRDLEVWASLAKICEKKGVFICTNGAVYDPADPDERFSLDLFFALARRERAMTKKRVQRTVNSRAEEGRPATGKAPFGYTRTYGARNLIEDQILDEKPRFSMTVSGVLVSWTPARLAQMIFRAYERGVPAYTIADRLNELGIPNPRTIHALENHPTKERKYESRWNPRVIRNLVRNKAYIGVRLHKGAVKGEDRWVSLATREQFAGIMLQQSNRVNETKRRPGAQIHLLSGLMLCDSCDRAATSSTSNGVPIYRCIKGHATVDIEQANAFVTYWILTWLSRAENLNTIRGVSSQDEELAEARLELVRLQAEQREWEEIAGHVSPAAMANFFRAHEPKLRAAEQKVATLGIPPVLQELVAAAEPLEAWREMSTNAQRQVIQRLVSLHLRPSGRGRRTPASDRIKIVEHQLSEGS